MPKKTTEELVAEADDLGVPLEPDWGYTEILAAVKSGREVTGVEDPDETEDAPDEEPVEVVEEEPVSPQRPIPVGYPFDSLGRHISPP